MEAILEGFTWLIDTIKAIWTFISNIFETLGMVFEYIGKIVTIATQVVLTLPPWIQAIGMITISICSIYIVVGREAGKSD